MMMMNCICGMGLTNKRLLVLFPVRTIVKDSHHCKSLTCCKQDLNLCRTRVQALLNKVVHAVVITTTLQSQEHVNGNFIRMGVW